MTETELATFVGAVKPIGVAILFVMANLVRPPQIKDLARIISMNAKTLAPEMDHLETLGYIQSSLAGRHPRWMLTDKARQLPLFALSELTGMLLAGQPVRADEARPGMLLAEQPSPREDWNDDQRNSLLTSVVVVDQISDLDLDQQHQQQQQQQASGEFLRSERRAEVLQACVGLGIGYPTNRRLADDEWVTADRLCRAVRQCRFEGRWQNPIGQAITRLEDHLEPKTTAELDALEAPEAPPDEAISMDIPPDLPRVPSPDPDRAAQRIWHAALGELQIQMTKPTFETYVKPAILVGYNPSHSPDPLFTFAVENEHLRDWLETKLRTSITRALAGITNRPVRVRIVTWSEAS